MGIVYSQYNLLIKSKLTLNTKQSGTTTKYSLYLEVSFYDLGITRTPRL